MQSNAAAGMHTLNMDLVRMVSEGRISKETAFQHTK